MKKYEYLPRVTFTTPTPLTSDHNSSFCTKWLPPEILAVILDHCDSLDLLHFREVNSTFHTLTSEILRQRRHFHITFNDFFILHPVHNRNLQDFVKCLQNSLSLGFLLHFPCTRFEIRRGNLAKENLQNFFNLYGLHCTHLFLNRCQNRNYKSKPFQTLSQLLIDQLPNVQFLEIYNYHPYSSFFYHRQPDSSKNLFGDSVQLPNLKIFKYGGFGTGIAQSIPRDILNAAVNLQDFVNCGLLNKNDETLNQLRMQGRIKMIKTLYLHLSTMDEYKLEMLSECNVKLKKFCILHPPRTVHPKMSLIALKAMRRIILSSKETLVNFKDLDNEDWMGRSWIFQKVQKLDENLNSVYFEQFPNIRHLVVSGVVNLRNIFPVLCKWADSLEILEAPDLSFAKVYSGYDPHFALDVVFTGFSREDCQKLRQEDSVEEIEASFMERRQNVSILNLKRLKLLRLGVTEGFRINAEDWKSPFMTKVSHIHGFRMMPNLRVELTLVALCHPIKLSREAGAVLRELATFLHSVKAVGYQPHRRNSFSQIVL